MAAIKFVGWIPSFSDLPRAVRALNCCRRLAPKMFLGPLPWVAAAAMMRVASLVSPLPGSGASSWALLLALLEKVKASKTGEFDENVLLDGHLLVVFGKVLARCTVNKTSMTTLWSRSQTKYAEDFAKWATVAGVNVITTQPYSIRREAASSNRALANLVVVEDPAGTSSARVAQTGSQSRLISETRCRAKLHGSIKHTQRPSKDGWFVLHLGRSDQLIRGQIARLS